MKYLQHLDLLIAGTFPTIAVFMLVFGVPEAIRESRLQKKGVIVAGTVVSTRSFKSRHNRFHFVTFRFVDAGGAARTVETPLRGREFRTKQEVDVVYLPADPGIAEILAEGESREDLELGGWTRIVIALCLGIPGALCVPSALRKLSVHGGERSQKKKRRRR